MNRWSDETSGDDVMGVPERSWLHEICVDEDCGRHWSSATAECIRLGHGQTIRVWEDRLPPGGVVSPSEVRRLADAIERDRREPDKVLCHLQTLRRVALDARLDTERGGVSHLDAVKGERDRLRDELRRVDKLAADRQREVVRLREALEMIAVYNTRDSRATGLPSLEAKIARDALAADEESAG